MLNSILIIGVMLVVVLVFSTLFAKPHLPKCVILRSIGAQSISSSDLVSMAENAQETFISLFNRSSTDEWNGYQPVFNNLCKDLSQFNIRHQNLPQFSIYEQAADSWASKKAFVKNREIDTSLFCILKNLQIIKQLAEDVEGGHDVLDMRWFDLIRDIHAEVPRAQAPAALEPELVLSPDYLQPKRIRRQIHMQKSTEMELSSFDRSVGEVDDLASVEKEAVPKPISSKTPVFQKMKFAGAVDDRLERVAESRNYGKWDVPSHGVVDYTDLEEVRTRMRGTKDLTKKKTLAHDYDYLDDPEFNYS